MIIHSVFSAIKKLLPSNLSSIVRRIFTGFLTPVSFSYETGHFRSSLLSKAVDKYGKPLPWYTYPAIDFLASKDFANCSILEFGAGQSTMWWAERAHSVLSFESDFEWYRRLTSRIPQNVKIYHVRDDLNELDTYLSNQLFDIIIVDGLDRLKASKKARQLLRGSGGIIFDNSEGYWGPEGTYPVMDFFRSEGFSRIDFYGYAPGVVLPHVTSLFFKDSCFLIEGRESPIRKCS